MVLISCFKLHQQIIKKPGQHLNENSLAPPRSLSIVHFLLTLLLLKRELFKIPIERIEDPTLAQLFRERQLEIDRKFTMLIDIGTPRFLYGSLQLYGRVDDTLLKIAKELLEQLSPRSRDESTGNSIDAKTFAQRAKIELDYFRKTLPDLSTKVMVREDIIGTDGF